MSLSSKRKIKDIKCLSESYNIEYEEDNFNVLYVNLEGPNCIPWKGGKWKTILLILAALCFRIT